MNIRRKVLILPRFAKQSAVLLCDVFLSLLATWLAFTFRLDHMHFPVGKMWLPYALGATLFLPFFVRFGLYRSIFRYSGNAVLSSIGRATALYGCCLFAILVVGAFDGVPRSLGLLQPVLFGGLVYGSRVAAASLLKSAYTGKLRVRRAFVYGAGDAGLRAIQSMATSQGYQILGLVDDDVSKQGRRLGILPIYRPSQLPELIEKFDLSDILLAIPSVSTERRREILNSLIDLHIRVQTLPDALSSSRTVNETADDLDLQISDLLEREPIQSKLSAEFITGNKVLVTGAGGSIGSELCRQLLKTEPAELILVDHSEYNLYLIEGALLAFIELKSIKTVIRPYLASVRDEKRMERIFRRHCPELVYHAAAYKHVPLVEANCFDAVENNIFGTLIVARNAAENGCRRFTLISTDKAVRPTNIMGATKRFAERIIQALAATPGQTTVFSMVRFGNVLGSSGSVVPLFRQQISRGGPVTVTHRDVIRYFMTIPEAVGLVLQASAMSKGGEVFLLDMGEPVRIFDLARRMIRLAGLTEKTDDNPDGDIAIVEVGLRPGEKLFEELLIGNNPQKTDNAHIMMAREEFLERPQLDTEIAQLREALQNEDFQIIDKLLPRTKGNGDRELPDHLRY
jgi:FlaA1/EpsC-like NDP-sugar epimerase